VHTHFFARPHASYVSRRDFLGQAGAGFGMVALSSLLAERTATAQAPNPLAPRPPHFAAKAKSVIWLFMNGGPSHVDTWDYKPDLVHRDGQTVQGFDRFTGFFADQVGPIMRSPYRFQRHGQCGHYVSEIFPNMARHVDKMAFIHSMWTDSNNHSPALMKVNTGATRMGYPCLGSWVTYGLGSESQNLPSFVVMYDTLGRGLPKGYAQNWGAGFLPSIFQGTALKPQGAPIDNLYRPVDLSDEQQRNQLDLFRRLNRRQIADRPGDTELAARVETFELAYRMQMTAPEALDFNREPELIQRLYGIDNPDTKAWGERCLIARRLVERGVRFVQIPCGNQHWDHHGGIEKALPLRCKQSDRPTAALVKDLKQRGLLNTTLVHWGGEMGRLPVIQNEKNIGRDHNTYGFSVWLAGGGLKAGHIHGATDEFGHKAVENIVNHYDFHATLLHLFGLEQERLTFQRASGLGSLIDGQPARVVTELLA